MSPRGRTAQRTRLQRRRQEGVSRALVPESLAAGASGSTSLPLSDRDATWDAGAAEKGLTAAQLPSAYFWRDPDGDANAKSSYKLPFATNDGGKLTAVWKGVTAAAGALQGARGGVQIPSGDVGGVKAKVEAYYEKARGQYSDDGIKVPWAADDSKGESAAGLLAYAEACGCADATDYAELLESWEQQLSDSGGDSDDDEAMAAKKKKKAPVMPVVLSGVCVNCGHDAEAHEGDDNSGACTTPGCDCEAMEPDADDAPAQTAGGFKLGEQFVRIEDVLAIEDDAERGKALLALVKSGGARLSFEAAVALPEQHQPQEALPTPHASPEAPTPPLLPGSLGWDAVLCPEGKATDDGRAFAPGSITWRELPLTLMAMITTSEGGHIGAEVAGRIDRIYREGSLIKGAGVFDTGDFGQEISRMVSDGTLRGISVDIAVNSYEVGAMSDYFDEEGNWVEPDGDGDGEEKEEADLFDLLFGDVPVVFVVTDGVIGAATVCPFQAFADATISAESSLVASAQAPNVWTVTQQARWGLRAVSSEAPEPLTAAAVAVLAPPVAPPAEWFDDPGLDELTAIRIDDDGRIFGHAWAWNSCHTAFPDACVIAPHSEVDYAYFHLGEVLCEDGERLPCGRITLDTGHAPSQMSRAEATAHYDHTGLVAAHVVVGEDEHGGWVAGALNPELDPEKVRILRGAVLSGDWRDVNGHLELIGLLAVNVPGFPVPRRPRALVAGSRRLALVAAGVHQGTVPMTDVRVQARLAALKDMADRRYEVLLERVRAV